MGVLITTESLKSLRACSSSFAFVTGSLFSGSEDSIYFEEGITHEITCSNSREVSYLRRGARKLNLTGSIHNLETGVSQTFKKPLYFNTDEEMEEYSKSLISGSL